MAVSKYIQQVQKAAGGAPRSTAWYRDKIKELGTPSSLDLIRDGKKASRPFFGRLNMFIYDPKLKSKTTILRFLSIGITNRTIQRRISRIEFTLSSYWS